MNKSSTIILTGAAGFIGSCMLQYLNEEGFENIIIVDDFGVEEKRRNWEHKKYAHVVERYNLFDWLSMHHIVADFVIHLGARTDTTEFDYSIHEILNVQYSKDVWNYCTQNNIPLIYASSAATYGAGEFEYNDNHEVVEKLQPLNPYGISKNEFDKWALKQSSVPPFWAGLKFFNVYGPNEYHKARMASVIFHSYNQIKKAGVVNLFKSHRPGFKNGEQLRDFIYVKDVVKVIGWMMERIGNWKLEIGNEGETLNEKRETRNEKPQTSNPKPSSGLYNLGTGTARSFIDLVNATFAGLYMKPKIIFIDIPLDIRDKYQYFTQANMLKLRTAGFDSYFYTLEEGVEDYVRNHLSQNIIW